jgi:hypothetical protein
MLLAVFITNVFALCFPPGDKYINGEIIPCTYPTYQPKERRTSKYESRRYERRRDGPPASRKPKQQATQPESASSSSWGINTCLSVLISRLVFKLTQIFIVPVLQDLPTYWNKRLLKSIAWCHHHVLLMLLASQIHVSPKYDIALEQATCAAGFGVLDRVEQSWHLNVTVDWTLVRPKCYASNICDVFCNI